VSERSARVTRADEKMKLKKTSGENLGTELEKIFSNNAFFS
jgi:hypothetical protein